MDWMGLKKTSAALAISVFIFSSAAVVEEYAIAKSPAAATVSDEVRDTGRETGRELKKGAHTVTDKACEWVKGKLQCAAQKAKHKVQDTVDDINKK